MHFKELEIWKRSRVLQKEIFDVCNSFPKEEKFRLSDQLVRSSRSIAANIAEGHGRYHYQENIQYCRVARGSISETQSHLVTAQDCGFLIASDVVRLDESLEELARMINGYIKYLKSRK